MMEPLISADSHVLEPADLWQQRVDRAWRGRAPRPVAMDGGEAIEYDDGTRLTYVGFGSAGDHGRESISIDEVREGGWDPEKRLADMSLDGVHAEVLYPSFGMRLFSCPDAGLQDACMRAYNDWLAEYCATNPERLLGQALLPLDVDAALAELARVEGRGFRGVVISGHPAPEQDYGTDLYERLWAALEDAGLPASLHIFTGPHKPDRRYFMADYSLATGLVQRSLVLMIFSGVFERYPGLRVVSAENDVGWVSHLLQRMDHAVERKSARFPTGLRSDLKPSEMFQRNVRCTFLDDRAGILSREISGPDVLMWGSDYPHDDSTWPESGNVIDRLFADVPASERRKIVHDNAAQLFGLG